MFRSNKNPMFRSQFSETIFYQKYAHEGCEDWASLCIVLVNDVCADRLSKSEKDALIKAMQDLKFIPGGRYLYYAGRSSKFFNNCGTGDTRVLTDTGWVKMGDAAGQTLNVLSPVDGRYYPAKFHAHGRQPVQEIVFAPIRGRSSQRYTVRFTPDHKWRLKDGTSTESLKVGDVVPANTFACGTDDVGFLHGLMFGDGNGRGQLRLCGDKKQYLDRISGFGTVTYPAFADGDPCFYTNLGIRWKELPRRASAPYVASFIEGWLAADGHQDRQLSSVNKEHLEWFREHAAYAGLVITGTLRAQTRDVAIGDYSYNGHTIYFQNYVRGSSHPGFKVESITPVGEMEVFCPFEPVHNQIVIDHGIHTYQCYLLRAEEDSREDWAELSWKSERALMTGGGIGVDYSVYRAEGSPLKSSGGFASGPIPKIEMINEIGRRVMQGGSRRSAIYASLNWQHGDIQKFITAKDWHAMPIPGTDKTIWDAKQADFNFPAPLDMTNISVNYDTDWLLNYWNTGDCGETFRLNVLQALSTGEPGFSFNFFDKERETLRNACTEVCSADDSDVCNLGSINLGRIEEILELTEIVELATKFLLCGTLVADLPYKKVGEVREKNRRLGLGLMGIHEWLLQRRKRYEVTPELHRWLSVYKGVSDDVSAKFADELGVSRPIARRAIAPTGTIGILAGTTTGIEPVFAVAYKRRFLKGQRWNYQYVVDSAAQELITLYGLKPHSVESALDLAQDYERRIKFQADVQAYVDQSISSTINLPPWGSPTNNPDTVDAFAKTLAKYAHQLRGFTVYPDGARGGQPLVSVPYSEAVKHLGKTFEEHIETHDICSITNRGGSCGV
jgi:ribonucleoside-diphosphate reductase alpha chain